MFYRAQSQTSYSVLILCFPCNRAITGGTDRPSNRLLINYSLRSTISCWLLSARILCRRFLGAVYFQSRVIVNDVGHYPRVCHRHLPPWNMLLDTTIWEIRIFLFISNLKILKHEREPRILKMITSNLDYYVIAFHLCADDERCLTKLPLHSYLLLFTVSETSHK